MALSGRSKQKCEQYKKANKRHINKVSKIVRILKGLKPDSRDKFLKGVTEEISRDVKRRLTK